MQYLTDALRVFEIANLKFQNCMCFSSKMLKEKHCSLISHMFTYSSFITMCHKLCADNLLSLLFQPIIMSYEEPLNDSYDDISCTLILLYKNVFLLIALVSSFKVRIANLGLDIFFLF